MGTREPPAAGVSAREAEVLAALGERLTNAEIAARFFISVRTVESHVSALLRKLGAEDRRALAALAQRSHPSAYPAAPDPTSRTASLPLALTPFVGRVRERATLSAAVAEHRMVTAVGPGGVGKTRLVLSVAAELVDDFADGVWYVDLVPVTDAARIAPALADVFGLGEQLGRSAIDSVLDRVADRELLVVLDNCEHLLDGVVLLLERLLTGAPGLRVLASSRARLLVPFERVFPVPGLSVRADDGGPGDAVELFCGRAAAGGRTVDDHELERVAAVCRALDGMALAIELAAARFPTLGLDGLETGLHDRLRLLTGGSRADDRHRSLRSALDWSYTLLDVPDQAVLRRVSTFAEPFTVAAATAVVADWPPVPSADVPSILAGLADHSLLIALAGPDGTRYRALETIRQYGEGRQVAAGEAEATRARHLQWCRAECAVLLRGAQDVDVTWRATFDRVADELRGGLTWAAEAPDYRSAAYQLAIELAELCFVRGIPSEAQRRYEQAAGLAADDAKAADALRSAAGAAESRHVGDDSLRLRNAAAEVALRAGDRAGAAGDLARNAEQISRGPGLMSTVPPPGEVTALIDRARELATGDPAAEARLLVAEAFAGASDDPATLRLVERALELARTLGDPLCESAALDQLTAIQLARGELRAAAASALRRTELLAPFPVTALTGFEFFDGFVMAAECAIAAGDLSGARRLAEQLRDLPFYREEGHLATSRLLVVTVLAGDWPEAVTLAARFRNGWERAGRPRAGNLSRGAYAAATVHALRGDDDARAAWLQVVRGLETPGRPAATIHYGEFFDALVLLHRGRPEAAVALLTAEPDELNEWYSGMWRPWYAAVWAESAVLAHRPDAAARVAHARSSVSGNPIAEAMLDRAESLLSRGSGHGELITVATALDDAGCRYQWARTMIMTGGRDRRLGEQALAAMGATPMAWPPAPD